MTVEVVSTKQIIPISFDEFRLRKDCLLRAELQPYDSATFSRQLGIFLKYPERTKIESRTRNPLNENFPLVEIIRPEKYCCPDLSMEFIPACTYLWVHNQMKTEFPEGFALLIRNLRHLDDAVAQVRDSRTNPPSSYSSPDFFEDRVSRRDLFLSDFRPRPIECML